MDSHPLRGRRGFLRSGLAVACLGLLAGCGGLPQRAEPRRIIIRLGFLGATTPSAEAGRLEAFDQGLRELGYEEGRNVAIEWRWAEGQFDRLPDLAAELARLGVDIIVAGGGTSARAAKAATATIPIVVAQDADPVGNGLTGLSQFAPGLAGKRLELLVAMAPTSARLGIIGSSTVPGNAQSLHETEQAAAGLGLSRHQVDAPGPDDVDASFREVNEWGADAVVVLGGPALILRRARAVELAAMYRLPATYNAADYVVDGGLMSYSVSVIDLYRRTAGFVDRIVKGARPADMPFEQPTEFELAINLTTARALGITVPQSLLAQATELIG
jgi:putative tryptophan/tyrosine transport system substrate-binding protein